MSIGHGIRNDILGYLGTSTGNRKCPHSTKLMYGCQAPDYDPI
ncbi:unnamed protein product, partial [marine sediment metagenome]